MEGVEFSKPRVTFLKIVKLSFTPWADPPGSRPGEEWGLDFSKALCSTEPPEIHPHLSVFLCGLKCFTRKARTLWLENYYCKYSKLKSFIKVGGGRWLSSGFPTFFLGINWVDLWPWSRETLSFYLFRNVDVWMKLAEPQEVHQRAQAPIL